VQLDRDVYQDSAYSRFINVHFVSIKLNGQEGEGKEYKAKFNVRGYPTTVLFRSDGTEIDRICGYDGNKTAYFQALVDYLNGRNTVAELQARLEQEPDNVDVNYRLARRYVDRWEMSAAVPYFKRILELDLQDTHGYTEECRGYIAVEHLNTSGDDQPLISLLEQTADTSRLVQGYNALIRYYNRNQMQDKLLSAYERIIERLPENADMMNGYAWYIYEQKVKDRYQRGVELAQRAVQLRPDAAHIWDTLAWLEFENGQVGQAIEHMKKAVELAPQQEGYRDNLKKMEENKLKQ
jgi:tetratricopeptide (TPR) repeat protein